MTPDTILSCSTVREQLPWLLNGTLDTAEAEAMNHHIAQCEACAAALAAERKLADQLQGLDALDFQEAASWDRMMDALEEPARKSLGATLSEAWERLRPQGWLAIGAPALAFAVVLAAILGTNFDTFRAPGTFETLSSSDPAVPNGLIEVRVLPVAASAVPDLSRWMAELGLTDVTGPSEAGLLRGRISDAQLAEILTTLRADARVALAVTDEVE
ncbi:MAG: hypothetical protein Rhims3KO_35820 [Hyphomicrobiales bacterium]